MPTNKIILITKPVNIKEIKKLLGIFFDNFIKAVVDTKNGLIAVNAELHADQEQFLLDHGSKQDDLWGINLYPENFGTTQWIEFDSMINIKPRQNNRARSIQDENIRKKIIDIVQSLIHE